MKKILYLGLDPERYHAQGKLIHYPIIQIIPYSIENRAIRNSFKNWELFTHLIFTSRNAAQLFLNFSEHFGIDNHEIKSKFIITVGKATASVFEKVDALAEHETGEGVVRLLEGIKDLDKGHLFFPHSNLARPLIKEYLIKKNIPFTACPFYMTLPRKEGPLPHLEEFDEIVFTSPSTVSAFVRFYGALPKNKKLTAIGPITENVVTKFLDLAYRYTQTRT